MKNGLKLFALYNRKIERGGTVFCNKDDITRKRKEKLENKEL